MSDMKTQIPGSCKFESASESADDDDLDLQAASHADLSSSGKDAYAIMSRFQFSDQLSKLLELPPWQKMLRGDTTLPVILLFTTAFTIAAAQKSKNTSSLPRL